MVEIHHRKHFSQVFSCSQIVYEPGGENMNYRTEVYVNRMEVEKWLKEYCFPEQYCDYCKSCPYYNAVWSCPPEVPPSSYLRDYFHEVFTIGVKVIYIKETSLNNRTTDQIEKLRQDTYGKVKRILYETLLYIEKENPGALLLGAGRCEQCEECTRRKGLPCRKPDKMRYSLTAFGFDFKKLVKELFDQELLWSSTDLPEYNLAVTALLIP